MTEHAFNKHGSKYVLRALQMLKEMGIRIAPTTSAPVTSFSHIMDYPLDCIKLDCDFVQRMNTEPAITAIVESIGILGQKLSIDIIAEGVETEQQRQTLCEAGFHIGEVFCSAGRWNPSGCPSCCRQHRSLSTAVKRPAVRRTAPAACR